MVLPFFHSNMGAILPMDALLPRVGKEVTITIGECGGLEGILGEAGILVGAGGNPGGSRDPGGGLEAWPPGMACAMPATVPLPVTEVFPHPPPYDPFLSP